MIYQILGWPRSRTAWLSNFLTYDKSFCVHEGMANRSTKTIRTVREYRGLMKQLEKKFPYAGDSNTYALLHQKYVIPGARVVIIERDRNEVESTVWSMGYHVNIPEIVEYPYNEQIIIPYHEINDNLKEIWDFCVPGSPYSKLRKLLLKDMNIQVNRVEDYLNYKTDA